LGRGCPQERLARMPRVSMFKLNGLAWALTKRVTIRDGACKKLLAFKGGGESFSELFERLLEGASPLETLMRLRGCVEFKDKEGMISEIDALRAERRP